MSSPGNVGRQATAARGARVADYLGEPANPEREAKPLVIEAGRCVRCGEEKSWLRPGETCAPCLVPRGAVALRLDDEEPGPVGPPVVSAPVRVRGSDEMAKAKFRLATCEGCSESFRAAPFGRLPKRCDACKGGAPASEEPVEEEEPEAEEPAEEVEDEGQDDADEGSGEEAPGSCALELDAVASLAVAAGLDPVELLLLAIVEAHRARRAA